MRQRHGLSERPACAALGVWRSVQSYQKRKEMEEEVSLVGTIIELAYRHRQYESRRITKLLRADVLIISVWDGSGARKVYRFRIGCACICLVAHVRVCARYEGIMSGVMILWWIVCRIVG